MSHWASQDYERGFREGVEAASGGAPSRADLDKEKQADKEWESEIRADERQRLKDDVIGVITDTMNRLAGGVMGPVEMSITGEVVNAVRAKLSEGKGGG